MIVMTYVLSIKNYYSDSIGITDVANQELVTEYRKELLTLIDEIHEHLQKMDFTDLNHDNLIYPSPKSMPNGWRYWYEKLSEYISGAGYPPVLWEQQILDLFGPYAKLVYSSYEELFLLVQAVLYMLESKEKR